MAEKCLEFLGIAPVEGMANSSHSYSPARLRYSNATPFNATKSCGSTRKPASHGTARKSTVSEDTEQDNLTNDHTTYLEERYGRNLPLSAATTAKRALRRRIAGVLLRDSISPSDPVESLGAQDATGVVGQSWRGVREVSEDDVFLYPTGMSAIWHAHNLVLGSSERRGRKAGKSVCFG